MKVMSAEADGKKLENIQKTLKDNKPDSKGQASKKNVPVKKAVDLNSILLVFTSVSDNLAKLATETQKQTDLAKSIGTFDARMATIAGLIQADLERIGKMDKRVQDRLEQFEVLEVKWDKLLERIGLMLDSLESALKRV